MLAGSAAVSLSFATMPEGDERPWTAKPMVPMGPSKTEYAGSDSAKYTFNEGERGTAQRAS